MEAGWDLGHEYGTQRQLEQIRGLLAGDRELIGKTVPIRRLPDEVKMTNPAAYKKINQIFRICQDQNSDEITATITDFIYDAKRRHCGVILGVGFPIHNHVAVLWDAFILSAFGIIEQTGS